MLSEVRPTRAARGARSVRVAILSLAAAAAIAPVAARAAAVEFTPTTPLSGTYATGASNQQSVTYYQWSVGSSNFTPAYAVGDDVAFSLGSGSYVIASTSNALDPSSMTFTGNASYDFTRASMSNNSSTFYGNAQFTGNGVVFGGADSFGSSAFTGGSASTPSGNPNFSLTLGTSSGSVAVPGSYNGTVVLRARPTAIAGYSGTTTINSGTLEIHDGGALVAANGNTPNLTLNGGTFAVNIDTGNYAFRQGNIAPASAQLGGTVTVNGNAALANTAVDTYGRARDTAVWQGVVSVPTAGTVLTVNTGGGTAIGGASGAAVTGSGTILIGAEAANNAGANRLRLAGSAATGSATLNFDLGANGILDSNVAVNGTTNLGSVTGQANTLLRGTTNNGTATSGVSTYSVGGNNASTTFAGSVIGGSSNSTGGGAGTSAAPAGGVRAPTTIAPVAARGITNTNLTKVGTGTTTLTGQNLHNATNVNVGTLAAQSNHALGDAAGAVTVASGATLDLRSSQAAGKAYVLNGGSLVNNGGSAVTINTGASAGFNSASATGGSGFWTGEGRTATVDITGGGGSGATGQVLLQLSYLRGQGGDGSTAGSNYTSEPIVTFSNPDFSIPGARVAKAITTLSVGGSVSATTIIDPGFGYTSVPTVTISGGGGTGFNPVFGMTASGVRITNAGTGYTSAPTVTFGGTGYEPTTAVGVGGFGSVTLAAASNVGGSGSLTINPGITGAFGLTKVGSGTTSLAGANAYTTTAVTAGTLATIGTGTLGSGDVTVTAGALSIGNAASIADAAGLTFDPSASIVLAGAGGSEVLAFITNSATSATITSGGVYTAAMLNSFFGVTSFSSLAGETVTIGTAIPEPVTLGAIAGLGLLVAGRRRRTA